MEPEQDHPGEQGDRIEVLEESILKTAKIIRSIRPLNPWPRYREPLPS